MPTVRARMNMIEMALDKVRSSVHGKGGSAACPSRPGKCWRGAFVGPEETPAGCIKMEEISGTFGSRSGGSESSSASASEVGDELCGMRHRRSIMKETELAAAAGLASCANGRKPGSEFSSEKAATASGAEAGSVFSSETTGCSTASGGNATSSGAERWSSGRWVDDWSSLDCGGGP